jgi:hypothetical protein
MAEVKINVTEIKVATVKLTKALIKQFQVLGYDEYRHLLTEQGELKEGVAVGWVAGVVFGDEWKKWLILDLGNNQYGRMDAADSTIRTTGAKQIYLA